ncbi:MAG: RNA-binding protein [Hyphomicrobiales bacterium]|nr:RNA-binding protein [Hyphomicrobiales bacterium]MCP5370156.1 RNA-binding protein [Hyphomicrobiales bacterium]
MGPAAEPTAAPVADAQAAPADGDGPHRRCLVEGRSRPCAAMVRFVVGPDQEVVPDVEGRLPGRGLWLSAARDVVNTACARNLFARAARSRVRVPEGMADRVEALLAARCLSLIGLARRAGGAVAGFEKVRLWLRDNRPAVLLAASDGAADGRAKIAALAPGAPVLDLFGADELGRALGRERVVHAALAPGRLADRLMAEADRLAGFRRPAAGGGT